MQAFRASECLRNGQCRRHQAFTFTGNKSTESTFNIHGISIGMTRSQVRQIAGPPHAEEQAHIRNQLCSWLFYDNLNLTLWIDKRGIVVRMSGLVLSEGSRQIFVQQPTPAEVLNVFGHPVRKIRINEDDYTLVYKKKGLDLGFYVSIMDDVMGPPYHCYVYLADPKAGLPTFKDYDF